MDNPETSTTLDTQNTGRKQTKTKTKNSTTQRIKKHGSIINNMGLNFRCAQCYSYIQNLLSIPIKIQFINKNIVNDNNNIYNE